MRTYALCKRGHRLIGRNAHHGAHGRQCRKCLLRAKNEHYKKNKARLRAQMKAQLASPAGQRRYAAWYKKTKRRREAYRKEYYRKHRKRYIAAATRWWYEHKDDCLRRMRERRAADVMRYRAKERRYRAKRRQITREQSRAATKRVPRWYAVMNMTRQFGLAPEHITDEQIAAYREQLHARRLITRVRYEIARVKGVKRCFAAYI